MTHDYTFSDGDIAFLNDAVVLPQDDRKVAAREYFKGHSHKSLSDVICNLIEMANVVIENNREMIELIFLEKNVIHPNKIDQINLPTLEGALDGLKLSKGVVQNSLCHGCAYRHGTSANTCLPTVTEARWQSENSDMFWCHEEFDEQGKPIQKCRGHLLKQKGRVNENTL